MMSRTVCWDPLGPGPSVGPGLVEGWGLVRGGERGQDSVSQTIPREMQEPGPWGAEIPKGQAGRDLRDHLVSPSDFTNEKTKAREGSCHQGCQLVVLSCGLLAPGPAPSVCSPTDHPGFLEHLQLQTYWALSQSWD